MASETVICETLSNFENSSYDDEDKFRNAIIVPPRILSKLSDTNEYEYVRLTPEGGEDGVLTQIISFSDQHDASAYSRDGHYEACIRTSLQKRIGIEPSDIDGDERDVKVDIHEYDSEVTDSLTVHRVSAWEALERDVTTEGFACYIHDETLSELTGLSEGDVGELINPENGARIQLPVETYNHKHYSKGTIRLDGVTRELLRVHSVDEGDDQNVKLRVLPDQSRSTDRTWEQLADWVGRQFVDYSYTHLRVLPGYDRDEGRNIVRLNEDTMEGLGIEPNDRALLEWEDEERSVRCQTGWAGDGDLEPEDNPKNSYGERESLSVRIPSTERDVLNISVGDSIRIRRDMQYQAGKQVSLSVFGILGVVVGTNQLLNMLFEGTGLFYIAISLFAVVVLSSVTVWLILKPIRQKCRAPAGEA